MYERFTDRARGVMLNSYEFARKCNHEFISAEHIIHSLLSLKSGEGSLPSILEIIPIDTKLELEKLDSSIQIGPEMAELVGKLPNSPTVKRLLEHSMICARDLNSNYVGTEHLFLALFKSQNEFVIDFLKSLAITEELFLAALDAIRNNKLEGVLNVFSKNITITPYIFEVVSDRNEAFDEKLDKISFVLARFHDNNINGAEAYKLICEIVK